MFSKKQIKYRYSDTVDVDKRITEANKMLARYPDSIPIIINCDPQLSKLTKNKFLVPKHISCSYILTLVRKYMTLDDSKAIFIFCDNKILNPTLLVGEVYEKYLEDRQNNKNLGKDEKYYRGLELDIIEESTFGFR